MKKTDIAMLILIASVSVLVAFFVAKGIFGDVYTGTAKVKTIDKIDSVIVEPSADIFNKNAINPAVQVQINGTK
ncbi:hypothetical protein COV88_03765 [Candidatus Saccharibacteria bacterium CG11_big_fil_rev_8_21_14_0_20_41_19]|nr:hypothetical protein [Candidatus Saccharibacteria bacterium]OIP85603.1 MAG: hypothetical protein AUK57_03325 [Candidatus Saccharibacteria bacterium CG2_30_41_52]PIQ70542.1 MAG: hypothetical protein COV88_03765 [Candidatus Saccharibacteria bacterium CG11_big_fil_rev_8_21_14_0_20_41_19]PIZ60235.1 MAG: hypothetical protein COY18_01700 [Candidatus Saccharibacteria bacterium CG_4_10_14_0_2_um_filter_41_11]PJC29436.1 MAG: hypothetical protein CO052_03270 [Candidatus Saccharibacteria bacterium CG_4